MSRFAHLVAAALLSLQGLSGSAQQFPSKPIRLVVPFNAGGPTDSLARLSARCLKDSLPSQVIVENRPGAAGATAVTEVANSPPDGQALLVASRNVLVAIASGAVTPNAAPSVASLEPIALVAESPLVLVVDANSSQLRTLKDVFEAAKKRATPLSFASYPLQGVSTGDIASMLGIAAQTLPLKDSTDAVTTLFGRNADLALLTVPDASQHIHSGRLRGIATTGAKRSAALPDIQSVVEQGQPRQSTFVLQYFLYAPRNTTREVQDKLRAAVLSGLYGGKCDSKEAMEKLGIDPRTSPAQVPNPCGKCQKKSCKECGEGCCPS